MRLEPMIMTYAENEAQDNMAEWVSRMVEQQLYDNREAYQNLVQLEHDAESHVTALRTDIVTMNQLKTALIQQMTAEMSELEESKLEIPLGSVLSPTWKGGMGPKLQVGIVALGTITAEFASAFQQAGINQTRHHIILEVHTEVDILTILGSRRVNVDSDFYVTDTIIVGTVPDQYTYIDDTEQGMLGKINDYAAD